MSMDDRILRKSMSSNFVVNEPPLEVRKGNLMTFIKSRIVSLISSL